MTYYRGISAIERFWKYVDRRSTTECWLWTGGRDRKGYGKFKVGGTPVAASRWLLGHLRGRALDSTELACHRCDNPPCVNPKHLYVGDSCTNQRDSVVRLRHASARKVQCRAGHPFTSENTRQRKDGGRECKACRRQWCADQRAKAAR